MDFGTFDIVFMGSTEMDKSIGNTSNIQFN